MGDLINFNKTKKRIVKARSAIEASANRAKFGRTKTEREQQRQLKERSAQFIDQHKLSDEEPS